ncbi:MAG TPA: histidine kinase, partial [Flavisolibacter sp.]|nr:histidine kinase [Flavisolibacter sp.]
KELPIMVITMFPMALLMNYFLFGSIYFEKLNVFSWATLVTFVALCFAFFIYGQIAVSLRNRFPHEHEVYRRIFITITIFVLLTGVYLSILCRAYDIFHFMGFAYDETNFTKCFTTFVVMNVFLTFLNEGVSRYESYRITLSETEQLKKEYMQSQLLGLKSQMNPHFLFNGLNTLSSLIQEDADKAEDFLDHMSKVYRYLLRNNEEQLVSLQTEINFIRSYYFLLKARYAEGLQLSISVGKELYEQFLPPLTLQMIFENILTFNEASRSNPLLIEISNKAPDELLIKHTVQLKLNCTDCFDEGIENISNKFKLLCQKEVEITETPTYRTIQLPLLKTKELTEA